VRDRDCRWSVENWATALIANLRISKPPIDLFEVARSRLIRNVKFRYMIPRGGLIPIANGFEIYMRDTRSQEMEVAGTEPVALFSRRQRFTLAHEIAHTYFYTFSPKKSPEVVINAPKGLILESICDKAAGQILVPTEMLRKRLEGSDELNIEFVQNIATSFNVSLTVALRRLGACSIPSARCVILARRLIRDSEIQACCFGTGLLKYLPRPTKFSELGEWLPMLPPSIKGGKGDCQWETSRAGQSLLFETKAMGSDDTFMLQVKEL
jgi:hypothetical protein